MTFSDFIPGIIIILGSPLALIISGIIAVTLEHFNKRKK